MKTNFTNPLSRLLSLTFMTILLVGTSAWASVPATPTNLTATAVSSSQINLTWTDNAINESYYRIERSANGVDNWYMFSATNANATSYSVTGLAAGTTYYYRVRAEQVRVGVSDPSNVASATTFSSSGRVAATMSVVAAPTNLTATAVSTSQINLAWTDNATNESYYRIERSANGVDNWYMFSATNANATSYSVTGLSAGTTYYFRVRAEQVRVAVSDPSNVASATTFSGARASTSTPVENTDEAMSVSTWPNPASDKVVVHVNSYWQKDATISLHDAHGRKLLKDKIVGDEHTIDVSDLPSGLYIIQVSNATKRSTHKIFVN